MQPNSIPPSVQPERQPEPASQEVSSNGLERAPLESSNEPVAPPLPPVVHDQAVSPAPVTQSDDSTPVTPAPIQSPLEAKDGDNIEPAWVEKADNIITTQANDPHQQEESAEKLSQDYLKERFNIDVNGAN